MPQNPKPLGPEKAAFWRVVAMADATGSEIARAYEEGRLSHEDWADTVQRCRGCHWAKGCEAWIAASDGTQRAVPEACRNAARLAALVPE